MNEVAIIEPWYTQLVEDCKTIAVERGFRSRLETIEGYYEIGKRILQDNANFERSKIYGERLVATVAESLKLSERSIYYAIKIAETTDNFEEWLNSLPEGKNISWRLVCQKYLTQPKLPTQGTPPEKQTEEYCPCLQCGSEIMPLKLKCGHCGQEFELKSEMIRKR